MTKIDLFAETRLALESMDSKDMVWRSVDQKTRADATRMWMDQEFPYGLAPEEFGAITHDGQESSAGFQRREMLKLMGASIALAGVGTACRRPEETILPYVKQPELTIPGVPNFYATAMAGPDGAIGLVVESHDGRPTKIEGNPSHPSSLGAASIANQASVLHLYDPDRSRTPSRQGVASTWSAFDAEFKTILAAHAGVGGAGLTIVHDGAGGPTTDRALAAIQTKFPKASVVAYDPLSSDNTKAGAELVFGTSARTHAHLANAAVVVGIDSNFLVEGPDHLRLAREFSKNRSASVVGSSKDATKMNRLYAIESVFSPTGANADHRLRVSSTEMPQFLAALAKAVLSSATLPDALGGSASTAALQSGLSSTWKGDDKFLGELAKDLLAHKGRALLLVGERQDASVHALAHLINAALGAFEGEAPLTTVSAPVPASPALAERLFAALEGGAPEAHWAFGRPMPHTSAAANIQSVVDGLNKGSTTTVILVGVNPAFTAPRSLDVAGALKKAKTLIHAGYTLDESAAGALWHLPLAHFLEAWGDASAADGTTSIVQPLIRPLFAARSALELFMLVGGNTKTAHDFVRDTWMTELAVVESETDWRKALHKGIVGASRTHITLAAMTGGGTTAAERYLGGKISTAISAAAGTTASKISALKGAAPSQSALEVVVVDCMKVGDGRFGNLSWVQELPESMTKLCWDNALVMSPSLARALNIESAVVKNSYTADVVTLTAGDRKVEVPVFVLPGLAPFTVQLTRGYGRTKGGFIADGVGVDVGAFVTGTGNIVAGASIAKTGKTLELCSTQDHFSLDGKPIQQLEVINDRFQERRPIALIGTTKDYADDAAFSKKGSLRVVSAGGLVEKGYVEEKSTRPDRPIQMTNDVFTYDGQQWGMVIDLSTCTGCNACVVACQAENNIPVVGRSEVLRGRELHWMRIDRYFMGDVDEPNAIHQPINCLQCENAPCEPVCPVAATVHDTDGLNSMVYNRCIGTRYCANNCPAKVRRFNYFDYTKTAHLYVEPKQAARHETLELQRNPDVTVRFRGVMEKCTYCTQRIQEAKFSAKRRGQDGKDLPDGAVTPACAQTCPTEAITFGNINKADSKVAQLKNLDREYEMFSELNIRPRTSYLARLKNTNTELG